MSVENYPVVVHPSKADYGRAASIVTNTSLTVDQKKNRLEHLGFTYTGTATLTENILDRAVTIIQDINLNDQQKINMLQRLGFAFHSAQTASDDVQITTTAPATGLPWWGWLIGGIAALALFKK